MCTLFLAIDSHPIYDLILIGNRDEFLNRPTAAAAWWKDEPNIFAGRDLKAGGTWMGISKNGRFASLTNYRDPHNLRPDAKSRGDLVKDFLNGDISPQDYCDALQEEAHLYNDFNLLVGDRKQTSYFSNKQAHSIPPLAAGFYGLSNALLDTPWPKVANNKLLFEDLVKNNSEFPIEKGFQLLQNPQIYPDAELPQTGVPLALERSLSALFIALPTYGTRVSTIILREKTGKMYMQERSYYEEGKLKMDAPSISKTSFEMI